MPYFYGPIFRVSKATTAADCVTVVTACKVEGLEPTATFYVEELQQNVLQGSRIRFVLGCVIPRAGAVARSRNLGQALFGSPVLFLPLYFTSSGP